MDAGIEKECSALGGLFQLIMNDMKASYPTWEDFVSKGAKLQSQLRTTIVVTGAFLDAFQKVADMAMGTRGATKEIGSALTRMCMRHRSIESKLKLFTTALSEGLVSPLELKMEEWKKVASQLDKDHAKEYKKARADIKKKSSDTIKLQKKVKKGEVRLQLDSALQDVNVRYAVLEDMEKRAVCRALIEERSRYCSFRCSSPFLLIGQEVGRSLSEGNSPNRLGRHGSRGRYGYTCHAITGHAPTLSRRVSRRDNASDSMGSTNQLAAGGSMGTENGLLAPPQNAYTHHGERARAMSASGKLLTLGALGSDAQRSSRDSLHCSSGYSTQTTTPSCSEDTIHTHTVKREPPIYVDYESISLHGDSDSLHHLSLGNTNQSDFDKSSTMPRNSDLSFQYRKFAQSKRPASTVSLLAEPELTSRSGRHHQMPPPSHTATIRRKPSSKPAYRRGTISGGMPIPISTPQVPIKAGNGSEELIFNSAAGGLGYSKLCTSTQRGGGNMLNQIRGIKLRRTLTNDRSAPLLPPPTNHK
ncbi:Protein MTSS 1 [Dissostichus eleginoides]|uniref:Protein MTSS 1 n=1 Tax=Dissostichus eleginoides TaxID=100907 RepID=A0AAD9CIN7_DISEL|nr:Protein MTSS 1 [Dissostichus eleginoides]